MHEEHKKFIEWALQYNEGYRNGRSLPKHQSWLERQRAPILKIQGEIETNTALDRVLDFIGAKR